ncbi:protein tyrosine phosphatase [Klebsiella pneumoniae]|uniref:arsenate reductase/protein-tyrosine-phosphatase family protein n=1 Tax=Klebsiella pneumoniae complex TaxID=3390273 RepID=UPI0023631855|nr:protein tyrosine phosphatase [Klebsiella pneumoniae]MDD1076203.1 protein tyrosine phosphatase [Klebsiella pneumoniae]HBZ3706679.1 protein tyrosine phosphatase [Klebsiella quasipneumoniae]
MFDSILVVCTGNICRSPIGERILRKEFPNKKIDSAGIGALVDHPADDSAILVAEENGISLSNHRGKQFTSSLSRSYDLILVMDKEHLEGISRIAPEVRGKTMLLGHWLGGKEIPDPYRKSIDAFRSVYQLIDCACKTWVPKLKD